MASTRENDLICVRSNDWGFDSLAFYRCSAPHLPQNLEPSGSLVPQFMQNDPEGFRVSSPFFLSVVGLAVRRLEATNMIAAARATIRAITIRGSV